MSALTRMVLTEEHHSQLCRHLFPGDGLEAAAVLLCTKSSEHRFVVNQVVPAPYDDCFIRLPDRISWPGEVVESAIDLAIDHSLTVILIHSHPGGLFEFSRVDDESDLEIMPSLFQAIGSDCQQHGSAIMTPDGAIRARLYDRDMGVVEVSHVMCAKDNISIWRSCKAVDQAQHPMAFSSGMGRDLRNLTACVVGLSGTGSIVCEQLARLGIGKLILVDFDCVEFRNLNRILNSTIESARTKTAKVDVLASVIKSYRDDIEIYTVKKNIAHREAIIAAGDSDLLFCCVDSFEGRQICDRVASSFLQPLFDVAVTIPTRQTKSDNFAVGDVCGRLDYIRPGGSTLADRKVYTPESLRDEYLKQVAPNEYDDQLAEGYIKGVHDEAPSVISLNMRAASDCVMELIARLYPFRHESNRKRARTLFSLAAGEEDHFNEDDFSKAPNLALAMGLIEPLLGMPRFAKSEGRL
jgi:proteasome lid subunit RPN8/RPN11